jgi:hypothetical protein
MINNNPDPLSEFSLRGLGDDLKVTNHIETPKEKHYSHLKLFRHKGKASRTVQY